MSSSRSLRAPSRLFLDTVAGGRTLPVVELTEDATIAERKGIDRSGMNNIRAGGPVLAGSTAAFAAPYSDPLTVSKVQMARQLRDAALDTTKEFEKRNFDNLSWIVAYQARASPVNFDGIRKAPAILHAGICIVLPDGRFYSLGINGRKTLFSGSNAFLMTPDPVLINRDPEIYAAFPFTTYFYDGIDEFIRKNAVSYKMYYTGRSHYDEYGRSRSDRHNTQFFNIALNRRFSLPGMRIPGIYSPLNCALAVQEILRGAIQVGHLVSHPNQMQYTYGILHDKPIGEVMVKFLYNLLFGFRRGEKDICVNHTRFCEIIESSMPPGHRGGRRRRTLKQKLKRKASKKTPDHVRP